MAAKDLMYKKGDIVQVVGSTDNVYDDFIGKPHPIIGLTGTVIRESPKMKDVYEIELGDDVKFRWCVYQGDLKLVANKFDF